jgi:hypothetical protein
MEYTIAAKLATEEVYRELTPSLRFSSAEHAKQWLVDNYPHTLNGVHIRPSVYHGLQPLVIVALR